MLIVAAPASDAGKLSGKVTTMVLPERTAEVWVPFSVQAAVDSVFGNAMGVLSQIPGVGVASWMIPRLKL